jgi:dihydrofolate reductase
MAIPVSMVAALADNRVIGRDNHLIWRLKSDMRRFRSLTMGTPMIMGRKTFESIGRPLPGRRTIMLTRGAGGAAQEGVLVARGMEEALSLARQCAAEMGAPRITVAGGADIYAQAMPLADELRLTFVHATPEGDALFPAIDHSVYVETARETHGAGPDDEFAFTFVDYERRVARIGR